MLLQDEFIQWVESKANLPESASIAIGDLCIANVKGKLTN
jgi:hypothetical protein